MDKGPHIYKLSNKFNFFGYIEHFLLYLLTLPWMSMQDLPLSVFKCPCFCYYLIETFVSGSFLLLWIKAIFRLQGGGYKNN